MIHREDKNMLGLVPPLQPLVISPGIPTVFYSAGESLHLKQTEPYQHPP